MTTFEAAFSWICVAPGSIARSMSTTGSSGSQSTSTSSSASSAAAFVSATMAATPAPVNVTRSISSARGVATKFSTPPACQAHGSGFRCSRSLPVTTATTPGAAAARDVSMPRMRACAYGERRIETYVVPWRFRSSRYCAAPVKSRGSSTRRTLAPMSSVGVSVAAIAQTLAPPAAASRIARTMFW